MQHIYSDILLNLRCDNVRQGLAPAFVFIIYILWVLRTRDVGDAVPYKLASTFMRENVGEGLCALPRKSNDVYKHNPSASQTRHLPLHKGGIFVLQKGWCEKM